MRRIVNQGAIQQFNGREGETATFLSRCLLNSNGLGGGFAPRHLSRWASSRFNGQMPIYRVKIYA